MAWRRLPKISCFVLLNLLSLSEALKCWQCASVDGRTCPDNAKMVESEDHDACITWRLGNGTVILQNVVTYESECTPAKLDFWTRFINLYYQSTGGEVRCCDTDGCNTGSFNDNFAVMTPTSNMAGQLSLPIPAVGGGGGGGVNAGNNLPGGGLSAGGAINAMPAASGLVNRQNLQQQSMQSFLEQFPGAPMLFGSGQSSSAPLPQQVVQRQSNSNLGNSNSFLVQPTLPTLPPQVVASQQLANQFQQQQQSLAAANNLNFGGSNNGAAAGFGQLNPSTANLGLTGGLNTAALTQFQQQQQFGNLNGLGNPLVQQQQNSFAFDQSFGTKNNGNCQRYFNKVGNGEWLPNMLIPLSFDRALEAKVGVFYARLNVLEKNTDHIIIRLVGASKSNSTMYSFKLARVGSISLYVSELKPNNRGDLTREEERKLSINNAVNISDINNHNGFWFGIRDEEISFGLVGDRLVDPILVWNDTQREGPRDVMYFALTTDTSQANFGINCDVHNLHFEDTCVTDDDCSDFPNTECTQRPINENLDVGTRGEPFDNWKPRHALLKSCFCSEGYLRIPDSKGCYDPIRKVVTLKDACFSDFHCNDLPNTHCAPDMDVPKYNRSCQCVPGNKPFDANPRTGLLEGCSPLTDKDRGTILGCSRKITVESFDWYPRKNFILTEHDSNLDADTGVFFVKFEQGGRSRRGDIAVLRFVDTGNGANRMYTLSFHRNTGKIAISISARTRSFFNTNERTTEKTSITNKELTMQMEKDYVGFWFQYKYDDQTGTLAVGLNGQPFTQDFALIKYSDSLRQAPKSIKYFGLTASEGSKIFYGVDCVLQDPPIAVTAVNNPFEIQAFQQRTQQQQQPQLGGVIPSFNNANVQNVFANNGNLNRVNPNFGQPNNQFIQQRNGNLNGNLAGINANSMYNQFNGANPGYTGVNLGGFNPTSSLGGFQNSLGNQAQAMFRSATGEESGLILNENDQMQPQAQPQTMEIVEPMIPKNNQYLTKLRSLLPQFIEDKTAGGFQPQDLEPSASNMMMQGRNQPDNNNMDNFNQEELLRRYLNEQSRAGNLGERREITRSSGLSMSKKSFSSNIPDFTPMKPVKSLSDFLKESLTLGSKMSKREKEDEKVEPSEDNEEFEDEEEDESSTESNLRRSNVRRSRDMDFDNKVTEDEFEYEEDENESIQLSPEEENTER